MYMFIIECVETVLKDPDVDIVLSDQCIFYSHFYDFSHFSTMSPYCHHTISIVHSLF